jgi:DNA-binding NarL/FixJ family response regulator
MSGDARRAFDEAVALYEACGARHDRARAVAALRAAGGRVRATRHTAVLSPSELAVAELVAQGLSNPEIAERLFISRRTVETHISRMFGKLGLSSRVELAVWFNGHGG